MKLAFDIRGNGARPLCLLHGFTGSRESFAHLEPSLATHFTLIRVDLPGHGATGPAALAGESGFQATIDAIASVLDEVGARDADLFGYSQGARLALSFAFTHPRRVRRLVLESGTPGLRHRRERVARRRADETLAESIVSGGVEAFVRRWEALPLFDGLRRMPAPARRALQQRRLASTAEGLASALRCVGLGVQPDWWDHLYKLHVPTLLLTGAHDQKFTRIARRMAAELPMVWSHTFADAGHAPHLEAPTEWLCEVKTFLELPWFEFPAFDADQRSNA